MRTSFKDLGRNIVEFSLELLKQRLELFQSPLPRNIHSVHTHESTDAFNPVRIREIDVRKQSTRADSVRWFLATGGWFIVPFTLGPGIFGVLLGHGEARMFRGAGPIADVVEWKERGGGGERREVANCLSDSPFLLLQSHLSRVSRPCHARCCQR